MAGVAETDSDTTEFLSFEALSGLVLVACAAAALVIANSGWAAGYESLWKTEFGGPVAGLDLRHSVRHWINDGLMALFFLVVGLEIKREFVVGELREPRRALLPAAAAVGGMVVPAALYLALRGGSGQGWAIPMATDIAFVVGCMAILGPRVPHTLKIFVLSLAIIDDLGAILVVALVYSAGISWVALGIAGAGLAAIAALVRARVDSLWPYVPLAVLVWAAFHESGVHATLAGVLVGLLAPAHPFAGSNQDSLLHRVETGLHPVVALGVMPVFALANAGVPISLDAGLHPETLAVAVGLVAGKPLGIIAASWLLLRAGVGVLPARVSWPLLAGAGCLAGIGFTMAAFLAGLALEGPDLDAAKIGVLAGSAMAGILGMGIVAAAGPGAAAASGPRRQ
ncbi:MAG: Na+/H+ antiporter NhaA [Vicinamibacterales bacterium]